MHSQRIFLGEAIAERMSRRDPKQMSAFFSVKTLPQAADNDPESFVSRLSRVLPKRGIEIPRVGAGHQRDLRSKVLDALRSESGAMR